MSISDLSSLATGEVDPATERILDAALQHFEEVGVRRTTIEDIARRAGVDRVTVYRRIGSKDDVVHAVVGRESAQTFAILAQASRAHNFEDRIAAAFTAVVRVVWDNALFNRLISLEPESALPRLTTGGAGILASAVVATTQMLDQAVRDGILEAATDLPARAEVIVRVVHSFVMTPRVYLDLTSDDQLTDFARRYIVPIAAGP